MTQSPYGSDPSREEPRDPFRDEARERHEGGREEGHEQGHEEDREQRHEQAAPTQQVPQQAPPTERVPVQPAAGGFARPSAGSSYGVGSPDPSSSSSASSASSASTGSTASWASGSYGSPSPQPPAPGAPTGSIPSGSIPSGPIPSSSGSSGGGYGAPTGSPYGDPYGTSPGIPTPPWGGQHTGWPAAPGGPGQPVAPRSPGFLANLFDTSFDRFVTPVVAKVAYLVVIVAVGLTWVANVVGALLTDPPYGLVVLVVGGVIALVTIIGARVLIEAVLALVRLAEDTRVLRDRDGGGSSS